MIKIAESEWIIMQELWKQSPLTSRQIIDNLSSRTNWNAKTIHTLISRLCKKGAIKAVKQDGNPFYDYYSNIDERECTMHETKNFLQKMYSGSLKNLVSMFVEEGGIKGEDITELRELLEDLEKENKNV